MSSLSQDQWYTPSDYYVATAHIQAIYGHLRPNKATDSKMSSENVEIGARLKELRNKTGLNQQEFAETIGVSYRSYRAYESGQREVTTAVLTKLYDLMGHSPMWVLTGRRTSLSETDMRVMRQAILAGLQTLSPEALNNSKEKASEFLQLVVKLSLQQGTCLSLEDTKAISRQDFE